MAKNPKTTETEKEDELKRTLADHRLFGSLRKILEGLRAPSE